MLSKAIKYTDYDGNEREETFLFNLSKSEMVELQTSVDGGLDKKLKKIIESKDQKEIISLFKEIVYKAYGEKSNDGRRFIKSPELSEAFMQTEAYEELFLEFLNDGEAAAAFVNAIIPKDLDRIAAN